MVVEVDAVVVGVELVRVDLPRDHARRLDAAAQDVVVGGRPAAVHVPRALELVGRRRAAPIEAVRELHCHRGRQQDVDAGTFLRAQADELGRRGRGKALDGDAIGYLDVGTGVAELAEPVLHGACLGADLGGGVAQQIRQGTCDVPQEFRVLADVVGELGVLEVEGPTALGEGLPEAPVAFRQGLGFDSARLDLALPGEMFGEVLEVADRLL